MVKRAVVAIIDYNIYKFTHLLSCHFRYYIKSELLSLIKPYKTDLKDKVCISFIYYEIALFLIDVGLPTTYAHRIDIFRLIYLKFHIN